MKTLRAELVRTLNRGTALVLLVCAAFAGFAMLNAPSQHHEPLWGFRESAIFLAAILMGRAATAAASDYGTGAIRAWLISSPRRAPVVTGKAAASVVVTLVIVAVVGVVGYVLSLIQGTTPSVAQLGHSVGGLALASVSLTLFGHAVGVLTRSVPAALAVTLAWILPAEHVLDGPIKHADRLLPGLVSQDISLWDLPSGLGWGAALTRAFLPFLVLEVIAVIWFVRRNVTV